MYGDQLVTSTTVFTVGYVIGQIPCNLLLTRLSPRWVIPSVSSQRYPSISLTLWKATDSQCSLRWAGALLSFACRVSNRTRLFMRFVFLLAFLSEKTLPAAISECLTDINPRSGFYPGIHYLLGSWYTPSEIGKRSMIFWLAGSIGQLFSGFLQAAAYTNLDGVQGRAGWRWLFIIDGIITLPLAVLGYLFFPNLPQGGKKTWWTTEEEHQLSVRRMQEIGRAGKGPWTMAKAKRIFSSWHTYLLRIYYPTALELGSVSV